MNTTTTAAPEADGAEEVSAKDAIYEILRDAVKEKTGKNIGKAGGRMLFDVVVEQIFATATKEGTIRLNGGFGSFHVRQYQAGERQLPSGQKATFGERQKLRYEEGVVVKALVESKGDLTKSLGERTSRSSEVGQAPAAPAAAAPAKATAKPAKAAKEPKAAKPAAAPKGAAEDDVDLD